MVESRIEEHSGIIPSTRLNSDCLMDETMLREIPIRNGDGCRYNYQYSAVEGMTKRTMFTHQSYEAAVGIPHDILYGRTVDFR